MQHFALKLRSAQRLGRPEQVPKRGVLQLDIRASTQTLGKSGLICRELLLGRLQCRLETLPVPVESRGIFVRPTRPASMRMPKRTPGKNV